MHTRLATGVRAICIILLRPPSRPSWITLHSITAGDAGEGFANNGRGVVEVPREEGEAAAAAGVG